MAGAGIVVVTKEEDLGRHCVELLESAGHRCFRTTAMECSSATMLIEKMAGEVPQLVLCELTMGVLTALTLLRDLRVTASWRAVAVAALSYDGKAQNEFIWEGGAAYVVMGDRALSELLDDMWRQVRDYEERRERKGGHRNRIIDYLGGIDDEVLFRQFAIRLFNDLDYREAHPTHGPTEMGNDIVFYEQNRLGELEFVGVQVKVGDIHGSVTRVDGVTSLWLQAVEAFNKPIPFGGEDHLLDKYVILTSGDFTEPARGKMRHLLSRTKYDKRIYMWGREKIADLIAEYAPGFDFFPPRVTRR
jgi:CheY-like chemotaxis protein